MQRNSLWPAVEDVRAFHAAFNLPHYVGPKIPSAARIELRRALITEELQELGFAMGKNDLVGIADGIADLIYVLIGTALEYGIPITSVWDEVQRSNMTKIGGQIREDGKVLKPATFEPPRIKEILDLFTS